MWAREVAVRERRPLVLAHAARRIVPWAASTPVDVGILDEATLAAGDELLEHRKEELEHGDIDVKTLCVSGDAEELLVALSLRAHLLVVGSRGRGATRRLVLGSVSSALVRRARCPVVVVREDPTAGAHGVLVGISATDHSVPVLEFAFRAASWEEAPLTVVHCYWGAETETGSARAATPHSDLAAERLAVAETIAGLREKYPDVAVTVEIDRGLADDVLTDLTNESRLVVVGSQPHGAIEDFVIGSVATWLIERAHCPVAVVPHQQEEDT